MKTIYRIKTWAMKKKTHELLSRLIITCFLVFVLPTWLLLFFIVFPDVKVKLTRNLINDKKR